MIVASARLTCLALAGQARVFDRIFSHEFWQTTTLPFLCRPSHIVIDDVTSLIGVLRTHPPLLGYLLKKNSIQAAGDVACYGSDLQKK